MSVLHGVKLYTVERGQPIVGVGIDHQNDMIEAYRTGPIISGTSILPTGKVPFSGASHIPVAQLHANSHGYITLYLAFHSAYRFFDGQQIADIGAVYQLQAQRAGGARGTASPSSQLLIDGNGGVKL